MQNGITYQRRKIAMPLRLQGNVHQLDMPNFRVFRSQISYYFSLTIECKAKVDIGFIIDGSGSIENSGKGNFKKVLSFVKELIRAFEVSKEATHVGIITYDNEAKVGMVGHPAGIQYILLTNRE